LQEENGGADGRVVLAFRGTQLGKSLDCVADICADIFLWVLPGDCELNPAKCSQFDNATLDYFAQAVDYTLKVIDLLHVSSDCSSALFFSNYLEYYDSRILTVVVVALVFLTFVRGCGLGTKCLSVCIPFVNRYAVFFCASNMR